MIELLAVIIILGVIFMFVFPKVATLVGFGENKNTDIIRSIVMDAAKEYSVTDNTLMEGLINVGDNKCINIYTLAEKGYIEESDMDQIPNGWYSYVKVEVNSDNNLEYTLVNSCSEHTSAFTAPELMLATTYFTNLCNETTNCNDGTNMSGLVKITHDTSVNSKYTAVEYRYRGSNPNNYVYFNCTDNSNPTSSTCEVWRIVGIFNGRVKLVRRDSIGTYSWDSSSSEDAHSNSGSGINQWGESGTYEGADLMRELNSKGEFVNTGYFSTLLSTNAYWYDEGNNRKTGTFYYSRVLKNTSQNMVDDAVWYTGAFASSSISVSAAYEAERGTNVLIPGTNDCTGEYCNDNVVRTTEWVGKVGLIYPSDFGYASAGACTTLSGSCGNNWLEYTGWTITPIADEARLAWAASDTLVNRTFLQWGISVRPSVYLKPNVTVTGEGTASNPYVFRTY